MVFVLLDTVSMGPILLYNILVEIVLVDIVSMNPVLVNIILGAYNGECKMLELMRRDIRTYFEVFTFGLIKRTFRIR